MPAKKTTILTADDDPQLLRLVARNLEFEDYDVLTASDGKQALEWDDDTFKEAGKVGVWTKADSVTLFDDFMYGAK